MAWFVAYIILFGNTTTLIVIPIPTGDTVYKNSDTPISLSFPLLPSSFLSLVHLVPRWLSNGTARNGPNDRTATTTIVTVGSCRGCGGGGGPHLPSLSPLAVVCAARSRPACNEGQRQACRRSSEKLPAPVSDQFGQRSRLQRMQ